MKNNSNLERQPFEFGSEALSRASVLRGGTHVAGAGLARCGKSFGLGLHVILGLLSVSVSSFVLARHPALVGKRFSADLLVFSADVVLGLPYCEQGKLPLLLVQT